MWEYTSTTVRSPNISPSSLNLFGNDGWELVTVTSHVDKQMNFLSTAYFKRRKEKS